MRKTKRADTNTFIAVALDEPEKVWMIEATDGHDLVAPVVLPYEIGNAMSSLVRQKRITEVPAELAPVDLRAALLLAGIFESTPMTPTSCSVRSKPSVRCSLSTPA